MCDAVERLGNRSVTRIIAALVLVLSVAVAQAKPLSPGDFTARFASALRAELRGATVTVQADLDLVIKDDQGWDAQAFLDNAYREYLAGRDDALDMVIERYVASIAEQQRRLTAKVDRARIVPVVKDRQWLIETQQPDPKRNGAARISEPYNDDLVVLYAEDTPHNIHYLVPGELAEAGLAQAELRALAVANLRTLLPGIEIRRGPLVSMIVADGNYESSLLLLDEIWSKGEVPARVDGEVVIAIPARGVLLFTGSRNRPGLARLRALATNAAKTSTYRLTDTLFVYRGGRFARFDGN
jgi:uncharacterized protein YtpQ (UPF0354 family)